MTQARFFHGLRFAAALVLAVGAIGGCGPGDPCQGKGTACITVQVEASGEPKVDLLRTVFSVNGGPNKQQGFAPASGAPTGFPILFALPIEGGGNTVIDVIAELAAVPVLRGSTSLYVAPSETRRVTVTLHDDLAKLPFAGPEPRSGAGLVAKPLSAPTSLVLFGGLTANQQTVSDTWEFDLAQKTWLRSVTANSPPPRQPNMAADPTDDRVLVAQGQGAQGPAPADTWIYASPNPGSARNWTRVDTANGPVPARGASGMTVWPSAGNVPTVYVFGGFDSVRGQIKNDLWAWQPPATDFTNSAVPGAPTLRTPKLFSWQGTVYLVGCDDPTASAVRIWKLDTSLKPGVWTQVSPDAGAPAFRTAFAAALDHKNGAIVVFGGLTAGNVPLGDTYRFGLASGIWTAVTTEKAPPPRFDASFAFANDVFYLLGGRDSEQKTRTDNWKLTQDSWQRWL